MATLTIGPHQLIVKYLFDNNGLPYYQRRVPKHLVKRIGKQMIRIKLDPKNGMPAKQVVEIAKKHDLLFEALKNNPTLSLPEKKLAAYLLLNTFGLNPGDGKVKIGPIDRDMHSTDDQPHLHKVLDYFVERQIDEELDEVDRLAYLALQAPLPPLLSELVDVYLKHHPNNKGQDKEFVKKTKRDWDRLVDTLGEMPADKLDRDSVRIYVTKRQDAGLKSGSIQRELNTLRAVVTIAKREGYFYQDNPFEGIRPTIKNDAKKRQTFTFEELSLIRSKCLEINDDIRHLVLMTMYTGARIGEIVGLRKEDCTFIDKIPCIRITEYEGKTVKTSNSIREIPLVLEAQEILLRAIKASETDAVFPRYNNLIEKPSADSASTYISRWLRELTGTEKTSHCFRHTMRDLFRDSDAPKDLIDEIHGGAKQNIADTYGLGRTIRKKNEAMKKAWKPFFKHIGLIEDRSKSALAEKEFKKKQTDFDF